MKPIWNLGFRPFFLLGAVWATLHILLWIFFQTGLHFIFSFNDPLIWHAHEMIFGFATAIVAGFLLTASQNWSGIPGIHGNKLKILVSVWTLARLFSLFPEKYSILFATIDLSFYPLLAWFLKPYLWKKSQKRNQVFFLLFFVLFIANFITHLNNFQDSKLPTSRSILLLAIQAIVVMIAIIGGRVIPFFTSNVVQAAQPYQNVWVERLSFISIIFAGISITFFEFTKLSAWLAFLAAAIHMIRWLFWKPWKSIRVPILFILYVGYVWIPTGFFLRGLASLAIIPPSYSTHAFTAGAIGTMIYGMITRVSLGHTGRIIHASKSIVVGYFFIVASSIFRVFGPWINPQHSLLMIKTSGYLWCSSFLVFIVVYAPILCKPRPDGKNG